MLIILIGLLGILDMLGITGHESVLVVLGLVALAVTIQLIHGGDTVEGQGSGGGLAGPGVGP